MKQLCWTFDQGLFNSNFCCLKQTNNHMFWLSINSQNLNDKSKYITHSLKHSSIKTWSHKL
jgi:hypothetical protein